MKDLFGFQYRGPAWLVVNVLFAALMFASTASTTSAQSPVGRTPGSTGEAADAAAVLDSAQAAIENLDYSKVRTLLANFIDQPAGATANELARAHLMLGIVDFSENKSEAARSNFSAAMQLDPSARPDPLTVSPKIVDFFESVRSSVARRPDQVPIRYVTVADPRPAAALRSMVLPGWGQYYKGQKAKAIVAGGAWAGAVTGTLIAHRARNRARQLYIDEQNPVLVADRYTVFNNRQKLRNTLAVSAVAVWLISYIDAIATPGRTVIAPYSVVALPSSDGLAIAAVWRL